PDQAPDDRRQQPPLAVGARRPAGGRRLLRRRGRGGRGRRLPGGGRGRCRLRLGRGGRGPCRRRGGLGVLPGRGGGGLAAVGRRRLRRGLGGLGRLGRRRRLGGRAPAVAGGRVPHPGEHGADLDRLALLDEDLGERAAHRRGHLGVDLVGRDLEERLVLGDL